MKTVIQTGVRFIFFLLVQVLILNHVEVGGGSLIMIYPLFVFLLPVEMNIFLLMTLAFALGISIDALSDTFGLHASSLVTMAYFRPILLKTFAPRDGYEQIPESNVHALGFYWFLRVFGILILIHHLWFFMLELFKLNDVVFALQKTAISAPMSFMICLLLQYLFIGKSKDT